MSSNSGTRSRESIICTVGSDVEDSSDESEHKENCSNSDIGVAVTDLCTDCVMLLKISVKQKKKKHTIFENSF